MSGPRAPPRPATPAQTPMALPRSWAGNTLVMIDRVAGMMNAPPMPMKARVAMSWPDDVANADGHRADAEDHEADLEGAAAAEAVAEAAGGEQQAGEDEGVGVDDPLEVADGGVEVRGRSWAGRR